MPETESQPTQQKLDEVENKIKELEHEVKVTKRANAISHPVENIKREAAELTTDTTKSPRKILTIVLFVGIAIVLLGLALLFLTSGIFWWLLIVLLIVVVLLSDRIR